MSAVITAPRQDSHTLMQIIERAAANPEFDLDRIEKLLVLKERWEANEAIKAFNVDYAAFKQNPPEVLKDKHVSFSTARGTTAYTHATHFEVTSKISDALARHGFHTHWAMHQESNTITVRCTLTHVQGHSRSVELTALNDGSGGKNDIQAVASANTYLQRYTLLAVTGLSTADTVDTDARKDTKEPTPIHADVWVVLNDAALEGTVALRKQWGNLSEDTRTTITNEYADKWNSIKQNALENSQTDLVK